MLDLPVFDPANWYWKVSGRADFWSSAAGAYVEALPEDREFTPIASEAELSDVLAVYGLRGPIISDDDVNAERDRRFALGAAVDLGDGRAFTVDIDARSIGNITALALAATRAQAVGDTGAIAFRDHSNAIRELAPAELIMMAEQALEAVSVIYAASWALKDMEIIPADFADDGRWEP